MKTFGKYRIVREIARGGMGIVYEGRDPFLDRPVAIKVAHDLSFRDEHQRELYRSLFFNEMRAAGLLHHPGIVSVYDAGIEGEDYYIAMEYVPDARTLEAFCTPEHLLAPDKVAEVAFKCAEALDYAHGRGVIHRDIKPGNILLGPQQIVKLVDFSVALLTDPKIVDTQFLEPIGSPLYMAPEQIREEPVTGQADLFSLGVVLYELLTGCHPFSAQTLPGVTHRILNEDPPPLATHRPDVPPPFEAVVARALAKDTGSRYRSALDLAADLSQVFSQLKHPVAGLPQGGRVDALRSLSFFREFRDAEIWELLRWAVWQEYAAGEPIIAEGDYDDSVYIVVHGRVSVRKRGREVASLGEGECFGEIGYLARSRRSASVVASDGVSVLRLNAALIDHASLNCQVQFQKVFIRTLIGRLVQTTDLLAGPEV